jgi:pyruvate/2-oxoglutarate dehydrogenase complex dihydrolipoamide acyltransferase (E2) component
METTELLEWVVREGEKIEVRQVMVVLQTEKTSYEMESEYTGILHIISPLDVTLPITHVIALIADTAEEYEQIKSITEPYEGLPK